MSTMIINGCTGPCIQCAADTLEEGDQLDSFDEMQHNIERIEENSHGQTIAWIRKGSTTDVYSCCWEADETVLVVL
jgi:hypothetical protein